MFFPLNENISPAKKGYTLYAGETIIHSRYDPETEAERYIESLKLRHYKYFILIEPGLGYLSAALKKKFPLSKIITLHCSPFYNNIKIVADFSEFCWNPGCKNTLEDFLELSITDADACDIKLIDWKPSINAYGNACLDLASRTVETIRRISAGRKTEQNFGRRWIKNALRNLALIQLPAELSPGSMPVLVCAAGPSLEYSLNDIEIWKKSPSPPFIIAVSSAVPSLINRKIKPDVIIATDGGFWARFHLLEGYLRYEKRFFQQENEPLIAFSLTSALPSQIKLWPSLIIRDGSLWQEILLTAACRYKNKVWKSRQINSGTLPSLAFPQRGTVSAAALDLAFYASSGNVYICGLDFSHRDLLTHSRPHAFEIFLEQCSCRNQPLYSQIFQRENIIRSGGSHGIYSAWFSSYVSSYPKRLFTLGKSMYGIPLGKPLKNQKENKKNICPIVMQTVLEDGLFVKTTQKIPRMIFYKSLIDELLKALDNPLYSRQLYKELGPMLVKDTVLGNDKYNDLVKKELLGLL